ncbi:hypothetical protein [Vulgatibacter sp.]|uniref:hypothetical protein n=1 Tax=Vulgatibacter sp. TaxID=1971226 RepID=UPI00356B0D12
MPGGLASGSSRRLVEPERRPGRQASKANAVDPLSGGCYDSPVMRTWARLFVFVLIAGVSLTPGVARAIASASQLVLGASAEEDDCCPGAVEVADDEGCDEAGCSPLCAHACCRVRTFSGTQVTSTGTVPPESSLVPASVATRLRAGNTREIEYPPTRN